MVKDLSPTSSTVVTPRTKTTHSITTTVLPHPRFTQFHPTKGNALRFFSRPQPLCEIFMREKYDKKPFKNK
jgi:hypothetical protein